jgi:uncharacterized protein YutE (UPF0331/DUF86 family)
MVDADVLRRRIDALLDYLVRLERFRGIERETFVKDPDTHHLAERYLHLAIEAVLDIANHVIADRGYEAPETYRDAFGILAAHGWLDAELARRLQGWAGFRNVLVHVYMAIDHGIAWDAIAGDLPDLQALAEKGAELL